jgi:hypothetical protein
VSPAAQRILISVDERVQAWRQAIEARPHLYRLTAYGRWDIDKAVEFFARWAEDESAGVGRPALCRRCGRLLYERYSTSQQLHVTCAPPFWPYPAPPPKTVVAPGADASRRPTMTDPIAELIDAASETLRASMHIPALPEYPSDGHGADAPLAGV